jgi:hypothetical protein
LTIEFGTDADSHQVPVPGSQWIVHWKPATEELATSRDSSLHTAFVCDRKKLPFAGYSVVKEPCSKLPAPGLVERRCRRASLQSLSDVRSGAFTARPTFLSYVSRSHAASRTIRKSLAPTPGSRADVRLRVASSRHIPAERRLVENTGLEPVTSWLQTRRSPS